VRCLVLLALCLAAGGACAQWQRTPSVVVIGTADDPRLPAVHEAVAFWNRTLEEVGSGFRLGAVKRVDAPVPEAALQELSRTLGRGVPVPQPLRGLPGDLNIVLGHSNFISFSAHGVIGIKGAGLFPMNLPNVPRNLIAHELGHAIGLRHNADPSMLMCGRPAPCRPDAFQSAEPRYFPLNDGDKRQLLRMYPADWKPSAPL
jgi:hypothetical protein